LTDTKHMPREYATVYCLAFGNLCYSECKTRKAGKFTMDVREAAEVALTLKPRVVIPMHHLNADH